MKTYFVSSDLHSFFTEWQLALNQAGFDINNPEHILIICGDLFDRGNESLKLYDFVRKFPKDRRILVRGNHEDIALSLVNDLNKIKLLKKQGITCKIFQFDSTDYTNGTVKTLCNLLGFEEWMTLYDQEYSYKVVDAFSKSDVYKWLKSKEFVNYYELGKYIFVHSFIPVNNVSAPHVHIYSQDESNYQLKYNPSWRKNSTQQEFEESRWGCPWAEYKAGLFKEEEAKGKILVCGHWHTSDFYLHMPPDDNISNFTKEDWDTVHYKCPIYKSKDFNLIGIDACTAYTHRTNVLVIKEEDL
jgi:serine/threonine protein phosphatase 1